MSAAVEIAAVTSRAQLEECWSVRLDVFVGEQNVPIEEEIDDLDFADSTRHVLATEVATGRGLGTGRLLAGPATNPEELHIGRMAVRPEARGLHLGAQLITALEQIAVGQAKEAGRRHVRLMLSAQEHAMGFYARQGYAVVSGESYLDAGIPHQDMAKVIEV